MKWWHEQWTEKLAPIIDDVREALGKSNDAKVIVSNMLFGKAWRRIKGDDSLLRKLVRDGVNKQVREYLKEGEEGYAGDAEFVTAEQLALWPAGDHQKLVRNIDRTRVFVPSRGEFVPIEPEKLPAAEAREAGKYLVKQGAEMTRRGELLVALADLGGW